MRQTIIINQAKQIEIDIQGLHCSLKVQQIPPTIIKAIETRIIQLKY